MSTYPVSSAPEVLLVPCVGELSELDRLVETAPPLRDVVPAAQSEVPSPPATRTGCDDWCAGGPVAGGARLH